MVLQIFGVNSIGVGVRANLGTADALFVAENVTLGSTDNNTTVAGTGSHHVDIQGTVVSQNQIITLGDSNGDFGQKLVIGENADVAQVGGLSNLTAVVVQGNGSVIDNRGRIRAENSAVSAGGDNPFLTVTIKNSGVIEAKNSAVFVFGSATIMLSNLGEMRAEGGTSYFSLSERTDLVTNDGLMVGGIQLGHGDDLYDGRGGKVVGNVEGYEGIDKLFGGSFAESFLGGGGNDVLDGGAGNDILDGGAGADSLAGGPGNDVFVLGAEATGVDAVSDSGGVDTITSLINRSLASYPAIENLTLLTGNIGGIGNGLANIIIGSAGSNIVDGGLGNDGLHGGVGNDTLSGGGGNDLLRGDAGNDKLFGGLGNDHLTGGAQFDYFVFNTTPHTALNRDSVADFAHGGDKFLMENAVFGKLGAAGALNGNFLRAGSAALDANDYIVYDRLTGALSYDANGNAAGGSVMFAVLINKPVLTASDFSVI